MSEPSLIRDLMTVGVQTCPQDTPISHIAGLLVEQQLEGIVVLDQEGHAVGVVTQDELVTAYARPDRDKLTATDIMWDEVPQVPPDIPITAAAQIMQDRGLRILFLMHNAAGILYPAAMISYWHLLRHLSVQDHGDLSDLGIKAQRQSPVEVFEQKRDEARQRAQYRGE